jgi:hypothetical protein
MKQFNQFEKRFKPFTIPNLTLYLLFGQIFVYGMIFFNPGILGSLILIPQNVLQGEIWRLITFIFIPPIRHPLFMIFAWYFFWLMGTALEQTWGDFRYNLFIATASVLTITGAFITPQFPASNAFIGGLIFLAFAYLNPNFEILLFFILPVKIKWIAWFTWVSYCFILLFGFYPQRLSVFAAIITFLLFFGKSIFSQTKAYNRRIALKAERKAQAEEPFHSCTTCGITDKTHPDMDFRYCSQCKGSKGYCSKHIHKHDHLQD